VIEVEKKKKNLENEDELVDYYCEFINMYSFYCDVIIIKSENEQLITQSMLFYYMMNKEYFDSESEEEDINNIKHIINQLEPHNEILEYEFFYEDGNNRVYCDLCNNDGDIPECVLCGRPADINEEKEIKKTKYKINIKSDNSCMEYDIDSNNNSINESLKCNVSSSDNVSEDENKINK